MSTEPDRTCKRCSVTRVNALVDAYGKAHDSGGAAWISRLRRIDSICQGHGLHQASQLLTPGMDEKNLRALCWNVSSFLTDHEAETILGIKLS